MDQGIYIKEWASQTDHQDAISRYEFNHDLLGVYISRVTLFWPAHYTRITMDPKVPLATP